MTIKKKEKIECILEEAKIKKSVPFLKWAGGKRWLASADLIPSPKPNSRYIEPFLGSGAIFFSVRPGAATLSDMNAELIETYCEVRDNPAEISSKLRRQHEAHCADHFYKVRASIPKKSIDRAVRFIYLNRTCWNGLYRVNQKGEFNVPIGTKTNVVLDTDDWEDVAQSLAGVEIKACDFEKTIDAAQRGDVVFADPPYTVKHNNNGFIKYNESIFSWRDQIRLKESLLRAKKRGVMVVSTNAAHDSVKELYESGFEVQTLERASVLAGNSAYRGRYQELLITANHE